MPKIEKKHKVTPLRELIGTTLRDLIVTTPCKVKSVNVWYFIAKHLGALSWTGIKPL